MLDHVFITVKDLDRSIAFYEMALKPLGIVHAIDYDGKDGPPKDIPTSRASDGTAAYSSGSGRAMRTRERLRISALSQRAGGRGERSMRQRWWRARPTTASPARGFITIPAITPGTFSIPMATASRRFIRAGSTPSPDCEAAVPPTRLSGGRR